MFSKPTITTRNDSITRKDVRSVLGSGNGLAGAVPEPKVVTEAPAASTEEKMTTSETETPVAARLIVGPDVKLKGAEILDCDTLVVEGRVEATMDSRVIRIADKGAFSGKVSIDVAEIHGCFEGELTARSQLIIHATGKVSGKIRYGKLVIDEGGELCGDINSLSPEKPAQRYQRDEPVLPLSAVAG
ncbi:polymer-forming cytoskeletal protein [uncultured Dechloromonas sp.]|uniref:bactofilin family protein n=1 Tax=uncultured Dechloromonas sp. TaxID=171719 RepID=UPI0025D3969E|nr:polymer-forming cytoskeletal protein [uncultured Dechloromonas sp.]